MVKKHSEKQEEVEIKADVVVLATGFERPGIDFLPEDLFPERYEVSSVRNWFASGRSIRLKAPQFVPSELFNRGLECSVDECGISKCDWDSVSSFC